MTDVCLISVPTNVGGERPGVAFGPFALKAADIVDTIAQTGTPVMEQPVDDHCCDLYIDADTAVTGDDTFPGPVREMVGSVSDVVAGTLIQDGFPLTLGGDHSLAIGSINGSARQADVGIIWFDAHGDFNTPETTPSGAVRGMPLAAVLGRGRFADLEWASAANVQEQNTVIIGARALDDREREALQQSDVTVFSMADVMERGIGTIVRQALSIAGGGTDGVHVSFDIDVLDPEAAPGVGFRAPGGLSPDVARHGLAQIASSDVPLRSMDVTDLNPFQDYEQVTAKRAVELVAATAAGL